MRKLKLFSACSLDGYIARPDGSIDWLFSDRDYGYRAFYRTVDTVLIGRKTYEQAKSLGAYPYKGKTAFVFSRIQRGNDENAQFISDDPLEFVERLRQLPGKSLWLVGGAQVTAPFLTAGRIDEYVVSIHPILLGAGIPLFPPNGREMRLIHHRTRSYPSGLIQVRYIREDRSD